MHSTRLQKNIQLHLLLTLMIPSLIWASTAFNLYSPKFKIISLKFQFHKTCLNGWCLYSTRSSQLTLKNCKNSWRYLIYKSMGCLLLKLAPRFSIKSISPKLKTELRLILKLNGIRLVSWKLTRYLLMIQYFFATSKAQTTTLQSFQSQAPLTSCQHSSKEWGHVLDQVKRCMRRFLGLMSKFILANMLKIKTKLEREKMTMTLMKMMKKNKSQVSKSQTWQSFCARWCQQLTRRSQNSEICLLTSSLAR